MTWSQVNGYPADKLDEALDGVKVVVIPAGVPRKVRLHSHTMPVPSLTLFPDLAWREFTLSTFFRRWT